MKNALDRLYRLRLLLEQSSRLELEMRLKDLAAVEKQMEFCRETQKKAGQQIIEEIANSDTSGWNEARIMMELASSSELWLVEDIRKKQTLMLQAKDTYLERRKERRQAAIVIETHNLKAGLEHDRKEQRLIDDWFGQRNSTKK